jgi:hypothetical protein
LFVRSFLSFFRDWNVLVGLFPTFFRRSPRSFVLLFSVFPNSLTTTERQWKFRTETDWTWISFWKDSGVKFNSRRSIKASLWFCNQRHWPG